MSNDKLAARILVLEEHITHQEKQIDELSDQLNDQWALLERMERVVKRAGDRLLLLEESTDEEPADTRPPHY